MSASAPFSKVLGLGDLLGHRLVLAEPLDEGLELGKGLGVLADLVRIALHLDCAQQPGELFVAPFFREKLVEHELTARNRW